MPDSRFVRNLNQSSSWKQRVGWWVPGGEGKGGCGWMVSSLVLLADQDPERCSAPLARGSHRGPVRGSGGLGATGRHRPLGAEDTGGHLPLFPPNLISAFFLLGRRRGIRPRLCAWILESLHALQSGRCPPGKFGFPGGPGCPWCVCRVKLG